MQVCEDQDSGGKADRAQFTAMMADAAQRKCEVVVFCISAGRRHWRAHINRTLAAFRAIEQPQKYCRAIEVRQTAPVDRVIRADQQGGVHLADHAIVGDRVVRVSLSRVKLLVGAGACRNFRVGGINQNLHPAVVSGLRGFPEA